jgi:membrane protein
MALFKKQLPEWMGIPRYYAVGVYRVLDRPDAFLWAQAIAFKVIVTIVPLIILATGVIGQVLRRDQPFETVAAFVREFLPPFYSDQLVQFLDQLQRASGALTIIGVLGLLISGITLFATVRIVISNIFEGEFHRIRNVVRGYAFDLRMVLQVGILFLISIALSVAVQWMNTAGLEAFQQVGLTYVWLREGWLRVFQFLGILVPFLITGLMFFQLIYFIPKPHPPKRSAALGAAVTAVLWEAAKFVFTFYATNVGRFDRFRDTADGFGAIAETFVLIIAFGFWVYFSGIVLIVGAAMAMLHERRHFKKRARLEKEKAGSPSLFDAPAEDLPDESTESINEPPPKT